MIMNYLVYGFDMFKRFKRWEWLILGQERFHGAFLMVMSTLQNQYDRSLRHFQFKKVGVAVGMAFALAYTGPIFAQDFDYEEVIEIKAASRDPGLRAKIAVKTNDINTNILKK